MRISFIAKMNKINELMKKKSLKNVKFNNSSKKQKRNSPKKK